MIELCVNGHAVLDELADAQHRQMSVDQPIKLGAFLPSKPTRLSFCCSDF
jgi:hypothetical protein